MVLHFVSDNTKEVVGASLGNRVRSGASPAIDGTDEDLLLHSNIDSEKMKAPSAYCISKGLSPRFDDEDILGSASSNADASSRASALGVARSQFERPFVLRKFGKSLASVSFTATRFLVHTNVS